MNHFTKILLQAWKKRVKTKLSIKFKLSLLLLIYDVQNVPDACRIPSWCDTQVIYRINFKFWLWFFIIKFRNIRPLPVFLLVYIRLQKCLYLHETSEFWNSVCRISRRNLQCIWLSRFRRRESLLVLHAVFRVSRLVRVLVLSTFACSPIFSFL